MTDVNEQPTPAHNPAHEERRRRLGRVIRTLRGDRTQSQLGAALGGVLQTTVSRWENGFTDLTLEQVYEVERALGVKPGTLGSVAGYVDPDLVGPAAGGATDSELPGVVTERADEVVEVLRAASTLGLGVRVTNAAMRRPDGDVVQWIVELNPTPPVH